MTCEDLAERLDAYALGALDAEEAHAVEAHLSGCPDCAAQAAEAEQAAAALALAAPIRRPAPALRERVLAEARRDMAAGDPVERQGGSRRMRALGLAAAAAVLALIGVTAWAVTLRQEVNDLRDENSALRAGMDREAIVRVVAEHDEHVRWDMVGTSQAPGATALLVWDPEERLCVLLVEDLPAPPEGQAYQLWLTKDDGVSVSLGTFTVDSSGAGQLVATVDGEFWGYTSAGVSMEPAGGSSVREGPVVLTASFGAGE